ncbi:hypothetical protein [Nocardia brevicatena]|uniref:hypothetical protein n=1 Tax=Nocardia brevicatena TaxID=37327 RepID=UPI0002E3778F|nr:hypothetical protein [Nocardia brevicatena]
MSDSDPADRAPDTAGATAARLPEAVAAVVQRWNPQGMALLRALDGPGVASAVRVIGPDDANTALLRTELARFEPRIELSAAVIEPGTVEPTASVGGGGTVALVLLDAGTVLGGGELATLRRLRADGVRVLVAMNGVHAHQDWRAVRDRDRALLAADGCDYEIIPVSARLAAAGRTTGDSALLDRSGLGLLHARLAALTAETPSPDEARAAVVAARIVADTGQRILEQQAELGSGTQMNLLREERVRLLAERDGGRAAAMSTLRARLHLARVDLMTGVGARVRALHTAARAELDRLGPSEQRGYPMWLQQAVNELTVAVDDDIEQRLAELAIRVDAAPENIVGARRDPAPAVGPDPEPRRRGVEDHLVIALGASAGVGLGRLVVSPFALVPALDVASVPVALLLGAGAAAWVVRARGHLADRNHLRQWVTDAVANIKAQFEQRAATALVEAETVLADRVVRSAAERMVDVDRRVVELETRLRRLTADQPGQLASCARDLATLDRWSAQRPSVGAGGGSGA